MLVRVSSALAGNASQPPKVAAGATVSVASRVEAQVRSEEAAAGEQALLDLYWSLPRPSLSGCWKKPPLGLVARPRQPAVLATAWSNRC